MTNFQVGAQLYSIRDKTQTAEDFMAAAKEIKAMGYNLVQISGTGPIAPEAIRDILAQNQLKAGATHVSYDRMLEDFDGLVKEHHMWDCPYIGIGGLPQRFRSKEGYVTFAKEASEVAKRFKDQGLTFIYHNHAFEFTKYDGVTGMDMLLENASPDLQFEIDTYWVQHGGANPVEWIYKVNGRMHVVHFKEMAGSEKNVSLMMPFGEGNLDWASIVKACNETKVKYAFIEQDNAVETNSLGCMRTSIQNIKKMGITL